MNSGGFQMLKIVKNLDLLLNLNQWKTPGMSILPDQSEFSCFYLIRGRFFKQK